MTKPMDRDELVAFIEWLIAEWGGYDTSGGKYWQNKIAKLDQVARMLERDGEAFRKYREFVQILTAQDTEDKS